MEQYQDSGFNIKAEYWFQTIRKKINKLKQIENQLSRDLINKALELKSVAKGKWLSALTTMIVTLAATLVISMFFIRYITYTLKILSTSIQEIEQTNDLTLRVNVNSKDELHTVASVVNSMLEKFEALIQQISSSSIQLATASEEVSSVATESANNVRRQQNETDQVATAINEEINKNIISISISISQVSEQSASGAEQTTSAANELAHLASDLQNLVGQFKINT